MRTKKTTRDYYVGARVSETERTQIQEYCSNEDISVSDWLRELIFNNLPERCSEDD